MNEFTQIRDVRALLFNRDSFKRKITSAIELMPAKTFLNKICFKKQENLINKWLTEVDIINTKISEACEIADIDFLKRGGMSEDEQLEVEFTYNIFEHPYILPIMVITVSKGKRKYKLNCLFDTGSQRTYFSGQVMEKLGCYKSFLSPVEYVVKTFLGSKTKKLNQVVVGIEVNKGNSLPLPVLIDDEFDMNLRFVNFKSIKSNLLNLNYKLAFLHEKNDIRVHGLLGIDVIQFMKNIKMVDCMKGSAWKFPTGISPLGNCQHFLYENQSTPKKVESKDFQRNYHAIVSKFSTCFFLDEREIIR